MLFSFLLYIAEYQGPRDENYLAALVTLLIAGATFVPEEYHSGIKIYSWLALRNLAAVFLLFFVFYASSTAAVLVNEEAIPGLLNLFRNSGISPWWIIMIPGLLLTPLLPQATPLFEFVIERIPPHVPSTPRARSTTPSVGQPRTPPSQTSRASSTTKSEQQGSPSPRARRDTPDGIPPNKTAANENTSAKSKSTESSPKLPVPPKPEDSTSTT